WRQDPRGVISGRGGRLCYQAGRAERSFGKPLRRLSESGGREGGFRTHDTPSPGSGPQADGTLQRGDRSGPRPLRGDGALPLAPARLRKSAEGEAPKTRPSSP